MDYCNFYKDKVVLVTGHTGFKGTWLCKMLVNFKAKVIGYSISDDYELYKVSDLSNKITSIIGDVRDLTNLQEVFDKFRPQIVFHLAAQAIVLTSYDIPLYTYQTNVMGTLNLLECIRLNDCTKSFINITTDKVYHNKEDAKAYKEDDMLDGIDPYSNSKSCSELITKCYKRSFFKDRLCAISTIRAGNVIGGGDFCCNRIIPDCVLAAINNKEVIVRNPSSIRPYQHVLEACFFYLKVCYMQYNDKTYEGSYNIGPSSKDCVKTIDLVKMFCDLWPNLNYKIEKKESNYESSVLYLDSSLAKKVFNVTPVLDIYNSVIYTVDFTKVYIKDKLKVSSFMDKQIKEYMEIMNEKR